MRGRWHVVSRTLEFISHHETKEEACCAAAARAMETGGYATVFEHVASYKAKTTVTVYLESAQGEPLNK